MATKQNIANGSDIIFLGGSGNPDFMTDGDGGDGDSSYVTYDYEQCLKFDSGSAGSANYAYRYLDFGSYSEPTAFISFGLNHDAIGAYSDGDYFYVSLELADVFVRMLFCSDGLYLHDGSAYQNLGSGYIAQDEWQGWTLTVKNTDDHTISTVDIRLNGTLILSDQDCSYQNTGNQGFVRFGQWGNTTANQITYASYLVAGDGMIAYPSSNASIFDDDCSDISSWTDNDSGSAESTQVTFDSKSCFKFDSGSVGDYAFRSIDVGSFGARVVFTIGVYNDIIGTQSPHDELGVNVRKDDGMLNVRFCSDGLYVHNGTSYVEIREASDSLVVLDVFREWTFDINFTARTVDVYMDGIPVALGKLIRASTETNGIIDIIQYGYGTVNRTSYIDCVKAGNGWYTGAADVPTVDQVMRHGQWLVDGAKKGFYWAA